MKKLLIPLLVLLLDITAFGQQKIQLRSVDKAECVSSDMKSLKASFSFSGVEATDVVVDRGTFSGLSMANTVIGGNEGDPQIPVVNELIAVPFGATPRVEITNFSSTDYRLEDYGMKTLVPRQLPVRKDQKPEDVPFIMNEAAYQTRGFRSEPQVFVSVEGVMRGVQLGKMTIEPVSYDPVNNMVRVFNDIEVTVHFDGADAKATEDMLIDTYSPYFDIVYKQLFNNRAITDAYADHPDLYSTPVKMLVVTTSTYTSSTAFQNWLTWKKQKGIEVDVQTVTSSTSAANVRTLIQNRYNANHPTFLVIVGDESVVKNYTTWSDNDLNYSPYISDNAYASIDSDVYHDMYMSRMSVANTTQLGYLVDKILMYEKYTMSDPSYLNETLLIAGWDEPQYSWSTSWTNIAGKPTINYAANNYFNTAHGITPHTFITTGSGQTTCYNYINNVGFINYTAHGDIQEWYDPNFTNTNVNNLTNTGKPFWAMGNCCLTANWGNSSYSPCYGEAMIRANNKGAFGYIGSIPESYWFEDFYFGVGAFAAQQNTNNNPTVSGTTVGAYDALFDETGFNCLNSVPYIGNVAVTYAHAANYNSSVSDEYYWRGYQCLGDGSVMPYLKVPDANNVSHNNIIPAGSSIFRVYADARSYVSITVNNEIIGVAAVPANATYVDVPFTTAPVAGQTAMIVVTRNQRQPYINNNVPIVGGAQYEIACTQPQHGTISAPEQAYASSTVTLIASPEMGYCLSAWDVRDADNHSITVTNNQFIMPESDVTVTATFVQGMQVTLASVMNGTISADPVYALQGNIINLTATPASGYNFDSWVVYKTDDVNTTVSVSGNSFAMPNYPVTVSAIFSKPASGDVTIGSGTTTTNGQYLPTYAYYNYSLTQQLYTSSEVGSAGTITKVAFKVSNSKSTSRSIDVYLSHTSKTSFSSNTDWISQNTSYRVFSGNVTFNASGWTTITLSTPFEYNGTSNLLLTVDDNTGSYVTSSSESPQFYTYSGSSNCAIYKYNDYTDYSPSSMSVSGTRVAYKNQVVFTKEVPSTDGYLSVSPTSLDGFNAVAGSEVSEPQIVAVIGANLQANLTVTAPTGYEVTTTSGGTYSSALTLTPSNGSVRANVYVRLSSMADPDTYDGNLTFTSGSVSATVALSGEVIPGSGVQYTITVNASPAEGGTVEGGGTFYEGSHRNLTATPAAHYTFTGWQLNGSIVSTDNPYNITVTGDANYTALFNEMPQYTVTVNQAEGGTITASPTTVYAGEVVSLSVTAASGYFFVEWNVVDANNQTVAVNDNQFTMPESNVTVTAVFTRGFSVTLEQTDHGTISANKTTALQPGETVTLTATPDNGCVFLAWYVYKTGNPRDVISVVNDEWFFMPSSDVTAQAIFVTEEEHEQTVGNGTSTGQYIPTYVYKNKVCHSLTQQIYTAAEIGYNGRINAIAFKANGSVTRNLAIYMAHTDKTAFSSNTDWEVMGSVAKVFSGSVSFTNNWATITLDTPFEYDGTSNLNLCVVDVTTTQVGNISREFSTYSTGANRAMYVYSTGNSATDYSSVIGYSNQLESTTGTRSTSNNQIKFTMMVPGSAESLTVSPGEMDNFSYMEGQGPSATDKLGIVGVDLSNDITVTAPTNFEISLTENGTYSNSLTIARETGSKGDRDVTHWGFEGSMEGWTAVDADGDGYNWVLGSACSGVYLDGNLTEGHDDSGDMMASGSWSNVASTALTPDNWLISPQVELGGSFSLWAQPQQSSYPAEHFGIYVSTSGTNISDFTLLNEWTLSAAATWKQFSVDLSVYTGQTGYIAVRHFNCTDQFMIKVDDFVLDTDAAITIEMPVTITPATVYVRMKANLTEGTYSGTLNAAAGNNFTGSVSLSGEVLRPTATQIVSLAQGWNWWTPTVEATLADLQTALASYEAQILTDQFVAATSIVPGQVYKIWVNADCYARLDGYVPNAVTVIFNQGLTWFGYTGTEATIGEALDGMTPAEGDLINSFDDGFARYENGAWTGTLTTLVPGKGYVYVSNASTSQTVTF